MIYFTIMPMQPKKDKLPKGLSKDATVINLVSRYLERAKKNLELMSIISELSKNREAQKALKLSENYSNDEWVIVTSYFAMYHSALALLAKIGYKSDTHTATIIALEKFFVEKELIGQEYLAMFKHAKDQINKQDIDNLSKGKENREIAQYKVTEAINLAIAEASMKNAYEFVNKIRIIIDSLKIEN